MAWQ
ncbi:hypothetical protein YPPY59_3420, partial [Yersinia pestis PY-59]|jgi:alpha-L-arabinofuranosidase